MLRSTCCICKEDSVDGAFMVLTSCCQDPVCVTCFNNWYKKRPYQCSTCPYQCASSVPAIVNDTAKPVSREVAMQHWLNDSEDEEDWGFLSGTGASAAAAADPEEATVTDPAEETVTAPAEATVSVPGLVPEGQATTETAASDSNESK